MYWSTVQETCLELNSFGPYSICQRFDAPVVFIAGTIEHYPDHTFAFRLLPQHLSDYLGSSEIAEAFALRLKGFGIRGDEYQRSSFNVVHQLSVKVA
jgi:hypothetical protein